MGRQPCCEKEAVKKGPWSAEEDRKLVSFMTAHGHGCWREVPNRAGLERCGKSCRLRWINYLRPDLKRGMLSPHEENLIIQLHAAFGNKWSRIAARLPGRTDNEIKNCWNTRIKKKLTEMGVDPVTHKPIADQDLSSTVTDSSENYEGLAAAPAMPAAVALNIGSSASSLIQASTGVNGPSPAGHLPFSLQTEALVSAHIYNNMQQLQATRLMHEGLVSVMNSQAASCLSHAPPAAKCEDEHSNNSSDSVSQDQSIISNVASNQGLNVLHLPPTFQMPPPHQLHAHHHMDNYLTQHLLHNSPYVCTCQGMPTPHYPIQNATHLQNALQSLPQASHKVCAPPSAPLHLNHLSQPQASVQMAQSMPHSSAFQLRSLQMPLPSSSMREGSEKPSSSSNNIGVRLKIGDANIKTDDESISGTTDISSRAFKTYTNEGPVGLSKTLQVEHRADEEAGDNGISSLGGGQYWSSMMTEAPFLAESLGGQPEQLLQAMSPFELNEASQAFGQQNVGSAGNYPLNSINVGPWSNMNNMECLLVSEPMHMITKYSLY